MCVRRRMIIIFLSALVAVLGGCEAMEDILPFAGAYKINLQINGIVLDECSYVSLNDGIHPFFEESVSADQDVSALIINIKNANDEFIGSRIIYELEQNDLIESNRSGYDIVYKVKSFDDILAPYFLPEDLPQGVYSIILQVMNGRNILQKTEKSFFNLGMVDFKFERINVYLPGITKYVNHVPVDTIVMPEVDIDVSHYANPYIIWYEGKRIIGEGYYNDGAKNIFWKSPKQSCFVNISAEIFPVRNSEKLPGYKKEVSLVVSSISFDIHLISENIPQLLHWYTFEGNLKDLKSVSSDDHNLRLIGNKNSEWIGSDGTYGITTGVNNVLALPKIDFPNDAVKTWQVLFRFKPLNDGNIFSVQFDKSNVSLNLIQKGTVLTLLLKSGDKTISYNVEIKIIPDQISGASAAAPMSFITAGISFSVLSGVISAQFNIIGDSYDSSVMSIALEADVHNEFRIFLGSVSDENISAGAESKSTALWDEFALYYRPPSEILISELKKTDTEQLTDDS